MNRFVVGVDIGGTKIAAGVVSFEGKLMSSVQSTIEMSETDPDCTVRQIVRLALAAEHEAFADGEHRLPIGIGIPAVLSRDRRDVVWAPNISGFRDFKLGQALEKAAGGRRIVLDFDGNTAVAAEAWVGAATGKANVVFLIIGTGVGAGVMIDGRIFRGSTGTPGGVGWFALDPVAVENAMAGRFPHFEAMCAGPGVLKLANCTADSRRHYSDTRELLAGFRGGDQHAEQVLTKAARFVGMGAANIVSMLNPEVLVIGGGMGLQYCAHEPLFRIIKDEVEGLAQPAAAEAVKVVPAALGPMAGVIGAARMAFDYLAEQ